MSDEDVNNNGSEMFLDDREFKSNRLKPHYLDHMSEELKEKLNTDKQASLFISIYGSFVQDFRGGNLNNWKTVQLLSKNMSFGLKCAKLGLQKPFTTILVKVTPVFEFSQSHKGWLTEKLFTQNITQKQSFADETDKKKSFLGRKKESPEEAAYKGFMKGGW